MRAEVPAHPRDADDPLAAIRAQFELPKGLIYLDGNSLGPLPTCVRERMTHVIETEWRTSLIRAWTEHDWINLPRRVGDKIARLIGAPAGSVIAADSTSINVVKALSAALRLRPGRKIILSDTGNFPTDLYMAQGLIEGLAQDHELRLVEPDAIEAALGPGSGSGSAPGAGPGGEDVAVVMLTQVDYRTGRLHDMAAITAAAHAAGALMLWDLAHSAGAMPVDLSGADADFAVGCGYKYLNGGPGAPAFIYVRPDLQDDVRPLLSGWLGHAAPFAFDLEYRPADGVDRLRVGTPPILSLSALDAALDVWDGVDMADVRAKSMALGDLFIVEVEARCSSFGVVLASPRDAAQRGSQVSFTCPHGYAVMQALIADGVVGDYREPNIIRFGFAPLYVRYGDAVEAACRLERVLREESWRNPAFQARASVT